MITRRSLLGTAAAGAGLIACPAVLRAQSPRILKLSHQFPGGTIDQGDARDRIARRFGQALEQRTGGSLLCVGRGAPGHTAETVLVWVRAAGGFSLGLSFLL